MYGVAQGALFCGESMFSRAENASKTALLVFCQDFPRRRKLIDCQVLNKHTASLGAVEIPRRDYLDYLSVLRLPSAGAILGAQGAISGNNKCFQHIFVRMV
jgi:leucyl/phenylalanyl-tRNA--protein transferase